MQYKLEKKVTNINKNLFATSKTSGDALLKTWASSTFSHEKIHEPLCLTRGRTQSLNNPTSDTTIQLTNAILSGDISKVLATIANYLISPKNITSSNCFNLHEAAILSKSIPMVEHINKWLAPSDIFHSSLTQTNSPTFNPITSLASTDEKNILRSSSQPTPLQHFGIPIPETLNGMRSYIGNYLIPAALIANNQDMLTFTLNSFANEKGKQSLSSYAIYCISAAFSSCQLKHMQTIANNSRIIKLAKELQSLSTCTAGNMEHFSKKQLNEIWCNILSSWSIENIEWVHKNLLPFIKLENNDATQTMRYNAILSRGDKNHLRLFTLLQLKPELSLLQNAALSNESTAFKTALHFISTTFPKKHMSNIRWDLIVNSACLSAKLNDHYAVLTAVILSIQNLPSTAKEMIITILKSLKELDEHFEQLSEKLSKEYEVNLIKCGGYDAKKLSLILPKIFELQLLFKNDYLQIKEDLKQLKRTLMMNNSDVIESIYKETPVDLHQLTLTPPLNPVSRVMQQPNLFSPASSDAKPEQKNILPGMMPDRLSI